MTWRDQLVAKILLIIARLVCDDPRLNEDIRNLANHIGVNAPPT